MTYRQSVASNWRAMGFFLILGVASAIFTFFMFKSEGLVIRVPHSQQIHFNKMVIVPAIVSIVSFGLVRVSSVLFTHNSDHMFTANMFKERLGVDERTADRMATRHNRNKSR